MSHDYQFGAARFLPHIEDEPAFVPMTEREKRRPSWRASLAQAKQAEDIAAHYAERETWRPSKTAQAFDRPNFTPMPKEAPKAEQPDALARAMQEDGIIAEPSDPPPDTKPAEFHKPDLKAGDVVRVLRDFKSLRAGSVHRVTQDAFKWHDGWNVYLGGLGHWPTDILELVSAERFYEATDPINTQDAKPAEPYRLRRFEQYAKVRLVRKFCTVKPSDEEFIVTMVEDGYVYCRNDRATLNRVPFDRLELIPTPEKPKTGEWIEHECDPCPCIGKHIDFRRRNGDELRGVMGTDGSDWVHPGPYGIVAYRILG